MYACARICFFVHQGAENVIIRLLSCGSSVALAWLLRGSCVAPTWVPAEKPVLPLVINFRAPGTQKVCCPWENGISDQKRRVYFCISTISMFATMKLIGTTHIGCCSTRDRDTRKPHGEAQEDVSRFLRGNEF